MKINATAALLCIILGIVVNFLTHSEWIGSLIGGVLYFVIAVLIQEDNY